jgi:hypothetical protein
MENEKLNVELLKLLVEVQSKKTELVKETYLEWLVFFRNATLISASGTATLVYKGEPGWVILSSILTGFLAFLYLQLSKELMELNKKTGKLLESLDNLANLLRF